MKRFSIIVPAAIALIVCSCSDVQTDCFCDNTVTLDNGVDKTQMKRPVPDKSEIVGLEA